MEEEGNNNTASADVEEQQHSDDSSAFFDKLYADDERMKVTASRKLTEDEATTLCKLMKQELNVVDEETDDDADTFLEYAVALIDGGKSVNEVIEEVR